MRSVSGKVTHVPGDGNPAAQLTSLEKGVTASGNCAPDRLPDPPCGLLLVAAWQDLRTLRIGNGLPLAIAALSSIWAAPGLLAGNLYTFGAWLPPSAVPRPALFWPGAWLPSHAGMMGGA